MTTTTPGPREGALPARLVLLAVTVMVVVVALVAGFGLVVADLVDPHTPASRSRTAGPVAATPGSAPAAESGSVRDRLAAAPMVSAPVDAALPTPAASRPAGSIRVPPAATVGRAGVPSGFPHTPEGAVGQLAAIEVTVLERVSLDDAARVHATWVLPGGPAVADWEPVANLHSFLAAALVDPADAPGLVSLTAVPAGGLVKGVDGPDWVLACVLFTVTAVVDQQAQVGYGWCARMQWHQGRWMIGPGTPAAPAPSTWPGSQPAVDAGWLTWVDERGR